MLLSLALALGELARLLLNLVEAQFDKRQVLALRRQQLPRLLQQRRQRGLLAARRGGGPVVVAVDCRERTLRGATKARRLADG
jgi:hypothetical protein